MAPTLFHKLFNKKNALSPPAKSSKEDQVFRYVSSFRRAHISSHTLQCVLYFSEDTSVGF